MRVKEHWEVTQLHPAAAVFSQTEQEGSEAVSQAVRASLKATERQPAKVLSLDSLRG